MRNFTRALLAFLLVHAGLFANAQTMSVNGRVQSSDGRPVISASIIMKGSRIGTKSNSDGAFTINANRGDQITVSAVGYSTQTVSITSGSIVITLQLSQELLSDVVVTAMDIKRNPKELGYSVQQVDGKEIQETQRENFLNSLQGRVAGLTINQTSGTAGASSSIVLRGFNSLSMSNQPLFVIDGIIVDNQTVDENSGGGSGVGMVERIGLTSTSNRNTDYANRISDINPNDIESITVLKGPEATALYGSQASSGAIIITTRKAKSTKLAVQYDNSFRMSKVARYPDVYDEYNPGLNGDPGFFFRYFGPKYAEGTTLYNNKEQFFKTGFSQTHNLGMDFGVKNSAFRVSGSFFDQDGIVPGNNYKRYNLRIANTTKFGKIVDISPAVSYIRTENEKVLRSAGGFLLALMSWPSTNDITASSGDNASKVGIFTANGPNTDFDNPIFSVLRNKGGDETNRLNTSLGININPAKWLSIAGRFGYEMYGTDGYLRYHPLSYYISPGTGGLQDNFYRRYHGYNHTITATAKKTFFENFNARVMIGTMWQNYKTEMYAVSGTNVVDSVVRGVMYKNGVVVTDEHYTRLTKKASDSSATRPNTRTRLLRNVFGEFNEQVLRSFAYFGEVALNYKTMIFLNYTHRFEEASTLPAQNRKFNYPGASVSLIISDIFPGIKSGNIVDYFKLRASRAGTARLNLPYSTQSFFANNLASGGGFSYGFTNNNPDLKPEKQSTYEMGTELRFLNGRITLDGTYYNTLNKGQIIENFRLSYGTGYVLNTQNAGSTRNQGVEISTEIKLVKKTDFTWTTRVNFNKMYNKVVELPKNVAEYYIADTWLYGNARGGIMLGNPTTTITSFGYLRNKNGDIVIAPTTGLPVVEQLFKIRGDRNPDFTIGWNNSFSYKDWRLSFLWDAKVGGDVFNGTEQYLTTIGRSKVTSDRMTPRIIAGVLQDGLENTENPTRNNITVVPYYNDLYYRSLPEEAFIEKDVNWFRLRDMTLSYTFPASIQKKIRGVKNLGVFLTGNDLILLTNYSGADPGVNGNTAGNRGVGGFGFDYGTLPAPISVNFGIRASF